MELIIILILVHLNKLNKFCMYFCFFEFHFDNYKILICISIWFVLEWKLLILDINETDSDHQMSTNLNRLPVVFTIFVAIEKTLKFQGKHVMWLMDFTKYLTSCMNCSILLCMNYTYTPSPQVYLWGFINTGHNPGNRK